MHREQSVVLIGLIGLCCLFFGFLEGLHDPILGATILSIGLLVSAIAIVKCFLN